MPCEVWLLGNAASQSLSPAMQNAAFAEAGIACRYIPRQVDSSELASTIADLRAGPKILGANVTIPHKESVIPLLDEIEPMAARIGALNTISRQGSRLKGWNTDVEGFRRALEECGYIVEGKMVAIIGAGGAARAVAMALQPAVRQLWVIARRLEQAQRMCRDLGLDPRAPVDMARLEETVAAADVIVNATPADLPPSSRSRSNQRTFDLRSRRSPEGRAMLLHQGAASFEIWTGYTPSIDVMRGALNHAAEGVPA